MTNKHVFKATAQPLRGGDRQVPGTTLPTPLPQGGYSVVLVLPVASPSFNALQGRHWTAKAKWRKKWAELVRCAKLELPWQVRLTLPGLIVRLTTDPPQQLTIDRYGPRMCDADNIVAGAKQLIDALVAEGFLVDDSPAHLQAIYRQHVGKPYRTEVRIE